MAELRSSALEGVARIGRALAQDHDGALDGAAGVLAPYVVLLGTPIALATKERNYRIRDSAHSGVWVNLGIRVFWDRAGVQNRLNPETRARPDRLNGRSRTHTPKFYNTTSLLR